MASPMRLFTVACTCLWACCQAHSDTGSRLLATGGISGFEGSAGGGIVPWAVIAGYGSREEIQGTVNVQTLQLSDYRLLSYGFSVGIYDRLELSLQQQVLNVGSAITSSTFNLLTQGQIVQAPGTDIEMTIVGAKLKLYGDAVFADNDWSPQVSIGLQYKHNHDFDTSLQTADGAIPLPNQGVPRILGASKNSGTDIYISATKLWLGAAAGNNLLVNLGARASRANSFGLLGFESAKNSDYELEWEGSAAILNSANSAIGVEFRTQSDRLGGLAREDTALDLFVAWFPSKAWSLTAAYVDLGSLPFEGSAQGFYVSITGNW